MGCCASRPDENIPSYHENTGHAESAQAINADGPQPLETIPSRSSNRAPIASRTSRSRPQIPTNDHAPAPLRAHMWTSKRKWTGSQLKKERQEFFETRVSGQRDVWDTLKVVTELLVNGDIQLAQSVIDAAEIVVPTGDLKNGAYDSRGNLYQMPEYIICDPVNVILDAPNKEGDESDSAGGSDDQDELQGKREGKGKAVAVAEDTMKVKARLSDRGGPDTIVHMLRGQTVRWLIRSVQESADVSENTKIKIAYMGKILKEGKSLQAQGWREGHVVNALVFTSPP